MLRCELARAALVDGDGGNVQRVERAVDEDDACAFLDEPRVVVVVAARVRHLAGDEDHPVGATVEQHVHVVDLAERRRRRVAEDRREAGLGRALFHRLGERGEDRVLEIRDEQPDHPGRRASPRRDVEQLAHRALDAVARLRSDTVEAVTTREAVATLTPACWATSRKEAMFRLCVTDLQDASKLLAGKIHLNASLDIGSDPLYARTVTWA